VTALFGEVAGQNDAQVFDGQRTKLGLGQRRFELFNEGADQGADIETVQARAASAIRSAASREAMGVSDMMSLLGSRIEELGSSGQVEGADLLDPRS
jgi:hypothetical protein